MTRIKDPCKGCGFLNEYGYCVCPSWDKWYACPIENKKPENIKALEEWGSRKARKNNENKGVDKLGKEL